MIEPRMIVFAAIDGSAAQTTQTNRATSMRQTTALRGERFRSPASKLVYFPMLGRDALRESSPLPDPDLPDLSALLQDMSFERDGYQVRVANGSDCLKRQAAKLIERMYSSRGLFPYGTKAEIDKRDVTVVALFGDQAVATLTVRMDFGNGLLADTLYSKEIDSARAIGGKVCEITQLALDPSSGTHDALAGLFQALYVIAQLTRRMTDIFIEVHPRHANFYQRIFGFKRIGDERICPRVGAPAVLLHLSQEEFERALARHDRLEQRANSRVSRLLPMKAHAQTVIEALSSRR